MLLALWPGSRKKSSLSDDNNYLQIRHNQYSSSRSFLLFSGYLKVSFSPFFFLCQRCFSCATGSTGGDVKRIRKVLLAFALKAFVSFEEVLKSFIISQILWSLYVDNIIDDWATLQSSFYVFATIPPLPLARRRRSEKEMKFTFYITSQSISPGEAHTFIVYGLKRDSFVRPHHDCNFFATSSLIASLRQIESDIFWQFVRTSTTSPDASVYVLQGIIN